jgi:hypothetical protein
MMKKVMILLLMVVLAVSIADARKKKSKAGKIKDDVYTDNKYGFSLVIPDKWDASIKKDDSKVRLVLIKKQYDIPNEYRHAPTYTEIPKVTVYVDTTSMPAGIFLDSLLSDKYKSDQKNDMLQEFKLLFGDVMAVRRSKMQIGDIEGVIMTGERRYSINVQRQGIDGDRADLVTNYYGGSLFLVKKGDYIIIFHFICEKVYFAAEDMDFTKLLEGFKFVK